MKEKSCKKMDNGNDPFRGYMQKKKGSDNIVQKLTSNIKPAIERHRTGCS